MAKYAGLQLGHEVGKKEKGQSEYREGVKERNAGRERERTA